VSRIDPAEFWRKRSGMDAESREQPPGVNGDRIFIVLVVKRNGPHAFGEACRPIVSDWTGV
jgi:hypothetical protein